MIGVFDSVLLEASGPSSWKFGASIISPFNGKEVKENEVEIIKELYNRRNNDKPRAFKRD